MPALMGRDAGTPPRVTVPTPDRPTADALLDAVAHKAFAFFWNETHPATGLTKDRAKNAKDSDAYTIASIASTGYMLASLPIAVERKWMDRKAAEARALTALRFLRDRLPNEHGFHYHFVDWATGERAWNCELSSIDSSLLVLGALTAGQYFKGEAQRIADALYERMDWRWMQNRGPGDPPDAAVVSMGWKPDSGFLTARWNRYNEASYLYLLALGAPKHALPGTTWDNWKVETATLEGFPVFAPIGPVFFAQMTPGYFDLRGRKDRKGRDFWTNFANSHKGNHAYCKRRSDLYPRHREPLWGITACDQPPKRAGEERSYGAQDPIDGRNDGTVAPTGALAGVLFVPEIAKATALDLFEHYRDRAWGRYGFGNALNPTKGWYDSDVIGIDLGMMLLCLENARSGLPWKLMASHPLTEKAYRAAGLRRA
ncbi:MAG TPA: glucoamylase family protein [Armatimonadaceae bacterium]|nr:glucoamylase family protein [Armatimonadaceae bacterium]